MKSWMFLSIHSFLLLKMRKQILLKFEKILLATLLVLTACLIPKSEAISQTDTGYVCLPTAVTDTIIKELELLDGLREEMRAQEIIIQGYEYAYPALQTQIVNLKTSRDTCQKYLNLRSLEAAHWEIEAEKFKKQRNILGGSTLLAILIIIALL